MVRERPATILADIVHCNHLQRSGRGDALLETSLLERGQEERRQEVLHEEHRPQDHVRRKSDRPDAVLDPVLVLEVRDAGLPLCRCDRGVHEMLDARLVRELGETEALLLLLLDPRLPGVLDREQTPRALQRALDRRRVVEIAGAPPRRRASPARAQPATRDDGSGHGPGSRRRAVRGQWRRPDVRWHR